MIRLDAWRHGTFSDIEILRRCKSAVREVVEDAEVVLYGSRARGDAQPDSDYDIVVITEEDASLALEDQVRRRIYPLELETGTVITLMLYGQEEWDSPLRRATPFRKAVEREGVLL
jgi:predicted nucleotidyltransferase